MANMFNDSNRQGSSSTQLCPICALPSWARSLSPTIERIRTHGQSQRVGPLRTVGGASAIPYGIPPSLKVLLRLARQALRSNPSLLPTFL